jgi:hypothetical protein
MAGSFRQGDLPAGGVAAVILLLLVFALNLTPWLAIPLAGSTYLGIALLHRWWSGWPGRIRGGWPRNDVRAANPKEIADLRAYEEAVTSVAAMRDLAREIATQPVREQVDRILDRADRILTVARLDGKLDRAAVFNVHLLELVRSILTDYVVLSTREIRSAGELLEKIETHALPLIEQAADDFYEQLHRREVIDLATLSDVLELNLDSIRASTPRRVMP